MRKLLVLLALAWVGVSLGAAWLSVDREIPYSLTFVDGAGAPDDVGVDWLAGWGTGLAAPLALVAGVAVLTAMSSLDSALGRLACLLVAAAGAASVLLVLSSRPARAALEDAGAGGAEALLSIATLALGGLLVLVGVGAFVTARRPYYR